MTRAMLPPLFFHWQRLYLVKFGWLVRIQKYFPMLMSLVALGSFWALSWPTRTLKNVLIFLLRATVLLDCAVRFNNGSKVNSQNFAIHFTFANSNFTLKDYSNQKLTNNCLCITKQTKQNKKPVKFRSMLQPIRLQKRLGFRPLLNLIKN